MLVRYRTFRGTSFHWTLIRPLFWILPWIAGHHVVAVSAFKNEAPRQRSFLASGENQRRVGTMEDELAAASWIFHDSTLLICGEYITSNNTAAPIASVLTIDVPNEIARFVMSSAREIKPASGEVYGV